MEVLKCFEIKSQNRSYSVLAVLCSGSMRGGMGCLPSHGGSTFHLPPCQEKKKQKQTKNKTKEKKTQPVFSSFLIPPHIHFALSNMIKQILTKL